PAKADAQTATSQQKMNTKDKIVARLSWTGVGRNKNAATRAIGAHAIRTTGGSMPDRPGRARSSAIQTFCAERPMSSAHKHMVKRRNTSRDVFLARSAPEEGLATNSPMR